MGALVTIAGLTGGGDARSIAGEGCRVGDAQVVDVGVADTVLDPAGERGVLEGEFPGHVVGVAAPVFVVSEGDGLELDARSDENTVDAVGEVASGAPVD
ncbi:hypothetical protein [Nocardiopsis sp. CNR-923]|uniref:hypothetical protein n=1 Tax=Nocardiopsis sp. CNR-923 TaxID=1904965 RepID=UPI00096A7563